MYWYYFILGRTANQSLGLRRQVRDHWDATYRCSCWDTMWDRNQYC